jgi:hypothetical protein
MIRHLHQRAVENQALMRDSELLLMAELLKVVFERTSHPQ